MQKIKKIIATFVSTSMGLCTISPGFAQSVPASAGSATASIAASSTGKQTKEQRKQARKEARAKNRAEMKKLQDSGYRPSRTDRDYPQDLQNAQKKAGIGQGASQ